MNNLGNNSKHGKRIEIRLVTLIFIVILLMISSTIPTFARYIYNDLRDLYLTSKEFYFTSNLLTTNKSGYSYTNWGGADVYEIDCKLYSYANELLKVDYDMDYEITCTVPEKYRNKIRCGIKTTTEPEGYNGSVTYNGIIYCSTNVENVKIYVIPLTSVSQGDSVEVEISARTTSPYQKTISATIELKVQAEGKSFTIEDEANQGYAILNLTNAIEAEANVILEFDPAILRIDMNDELISSATINKTETIGSGKFVKKITITMAKESAKKIKFYKVDKTKNYAYPQGSTTSAITVTN